ncbi:MAG: hypothetical protein K5893_13045 [Prevotella sp.]|nr:hypothetical protein [Prevotella sp.]
MTDYEPSGAHRTKRRSSESHPSLLLTPPLDLGRLPKQELLTPLGFAASLCDELAKVE